MREIKFRVFDECTHEMYYPHNDDVQIVFGMEGSEWALWSDEGEICDDKDGELMQFTGLKDKAGKPIFEGDILVYEDGHCLSSENGQEFEEFQNIGAIEWSIEEARFYITNRSSIDLETFFYDIDETEVIGNIYQNPELLNS